ncbi:MAG TPA: Type 1 glutamine amidotransferase-like domain-containing protein [Candidatus Saccharimonadales bacterium]
MRLFLSSQDLGHHAELAYDMCGPGKRVACIVNAQDDIDPQERADKVVRKRALFEDAGFVFEEIDLRDYFGKTDLLSIKLLDFDLVWCNGGNTFILRRALRASGLDVILAKRLQEDSIMYGGSSAGSCVAAPSLRGIDRGDRPSPDDVPDGYPDKTTDWEGLNLVPFMIVPHCDQEWFRAKADETVQALEANSIPYQLLNDGEVVSVDGNETTILRPEDENSRYRPISQKPYCCVPTCLQMVLEKNGLPRPTQEAIGIQLGLVVPPEFAEEFEDVPVSEKPLVSSGFGTRIQDPNYSLDSLIKKEQWPLKLTIRLASDIASEQALADILQDVETRDSDALICYQNDRGFGHVTVFNRMVNKEVGIIDPSPLYDKWRTLDLTDIYRRIQKHGDANMGGIWLLERV